MKLSKRILALILSMSLAAPAIGSVRILAAGAEKTKITGLKTEDLVNPVGIDAVNPAFSWKMESSVVGQKQTAYRIVVAKDSGFSQVVWEDTRQSGISVGIKYQGQALESSTAYYWQVTAWDKDGLEVKSDIATFEMGLLGANAFDGTRWISYAEKLSEETRYTIDFDFIIDRNNQGFSFGMRDTGTFVMWQVNSADSDRVLLRPHFKEKGNWTAYPGGPGNVQSVDITDAVGYSSSEIIGKTIHERIEVDGATIRTYFGPNAGNLTLANTYTHSETIPLGKIGFRHDNGANYENARYDNIAVKDSKGNILYENDFSAGATDFTGNGPLQVDGGMLKVGGNGTGNSELVYMQSENGNYLPAYRKTVTPKKELLSAKLYTSGLGVYESYINGRRVGRQMKDASVVYDELKPGFTQSGKRVFYNTYDVTWMLSPGKENVLSSVVTSGWWSGGVAGNYGKEEAYFAKLILTYSDQTQEVVNTDESWKTARASALQTADIFNGETYDARVDQSWMLPGYDDSAWGGVKINTEFNGAISAWSGSPITVREDLQLNTRSVTVYQGVTGASDSRYGTINVVRTSGDQSFTLNPGETAVVDFGQNFAGWEAFEVEGEAGAAVTIKHGEILNDNNGEKSRGNDGPEGSIYNANYRSAIATTRYILSGEGVERYHPSFTFYGFRYIQITTDKPVTFHSMDGQVVTSVEERETGFMETSDQDVNQLLSNIRWGMYSNYLSVPTDCPQRDERQGWTADTQVFAEAGSYLGFSKSFLMKFMEDMRDAQLSNGNYPTTAPQARFIEQGTLGWADAGVIVPYIVYMMYGDTSVISENWESMEKFMNYMLTTNKWGGDIVHGDWLSYESNDEQIKRMLGVSYYAWDALLMAGMAEAVGRKDDAAKYMAVYEDEKAFYQSNFVNKDGTLKRGEQSVCLYALYLDLLPDEASKKAVKNQLTSNFERTGNRLQTGFLGTAIIMNTLTKVDRTDIAYKLLLQHENPSWLYSVDQGATTIWERWNSYTKAAGFGDVSMNSFNHYAYGSVAGWMFRYMAGIGYDTENPGFKHILLAPQPDQLLGYVNASYDSAYGTIVSNWKYEKGKWVYDAAIPANTTATVSIPVEEGKALTVNGKAPEALTAAADGIRYTGTAGGVATFEAAAGSYRFISEVTQYHYVTIDNGNAAAPSTVSVNGGPQQKLAAVIEVPAGQPVTLKAQPVNDVDYAFAGWGGDVTSNQTSLTIMPDKNLSLTVNNAWIGSENLAENRTVNSNCAWTVAGWAPKYLVDGILTTEAASSGFTSQQGTQKSVDYWIEIDLGKNTDFNRIHLYPRSDTVGVGGGVASFPRDFSFEVRRDGSSEYTTVSSHTDYTGQPGKPSVFRFNTVSARYVRLHITELGDAAQADPNYYFVQLAEMGIYQVEEPAKVDKTALETLYNDLKDTDLTRYQDGTEKDRFTAQLQNANQLLTSGTATQAQIDSAAAELQKAFDALKEKPSEPADKTKLKQAIAEANTLKGTDAYKNAVRQKKEAFDNALAAAGKVYDDPAATEQEVAAAWMDLTQAIRLLSVQAGDKTALRKLYGQVEGTDLSGYQDGAAKENFKTALAGAKAVLADENASQKAIDKALNDLRTAFDALKKPSGEAPDKNKLASLLDQCAAYERDSYTPATWAEFSASLGKAQGVFGNPNATGSQVDAAIDELTGSMLRLELKADKSALAAALEAANGIDQSGYTQASCAALAAAVHRANEIMADENATQQQADAAAGAVRTAIGALVVLDGKTPVPGDSIPQTGDVPLAAGLTAVALAGAAALLLRKKREE